jgi:cobalt-zinc-cadmium efflux system outer membrane protein
MRWLTVSAVIVVGLQAQELDLRTALRVAASRHPLLKSAQLEIPLARADSVSASLLPNPVLDLQFAQTPGALSGPSALSPSNGQWQITALQTVDVAGQRRRRLEYAASAIDAAHELYRTMFQQVVQEVAFGWIELWSAERSVALVQLALTSADSLVAINRVRLRSQAIIPADVWRTEIVAAQYRLQLIQQQQRLRTALRWLQYALATTDSLWTRLDEPTFALSDAPLQYWLAQALDRRADYRLAEANRRTASAQVNLQDALALPNPDIGIAAVQEQGIPFVGIGLNYPLPMFNRNQGERQKARIALEQAELQLQRLRTQITTEVTVAYDAYTTAKAALEYARTMLDTASNVLRTVQFAYLKGATPIVDFLEAQRSWYETQRSYYDAVADYWRAAIGLLAASGQLSNLAQ